MESIIKDFERINEHIFKALEKYKEVVNRIKSEENIYYLQYGIIQLNKKFQDYSEIEKHTIIKQIFLQYKDEFVKFQEIDPYIFDTACELIAAWWMKWLEREENDWVIFEYFLNILDSELEEHVNELRHYINNVIENPADTKDEETKNKYYKAFSLLSGLALFTHNYVIFSTQGNLYAMTSIVGALALLLPALKE